LSIPRPKIDGFGWWAALRLLAGITAVYRSNNGAEGKHWQKHNAILMHSATKQPKAAVVSGTTSSTARTASAARANFVYLLEHAELDSSSSATKLLVQQGSRARTPAGDKPQKAVHNSLRCYTIS